MSISFLIFILMLIFSTILDNKKKKKTVKLEKVPTKINAQNSKKEEITEGITRDKKNSKNFKNRIIVDREKEIFGNADYVPSKDKIVNDIILAEVLNKPKCKK